MAACCFFIMAQEVIADVAGLPLLNLRERNLSLVPAGRCLAKAALTDARRYFRALCSAL
jgi:hypothetical protein